LALLLLNAHVGTAYVLTCYFTNWAQYRPGLGKYTPENVDPCLCNHLIYAFAGMNNNELTTYEWKLLVGFPTYGKSFTLQNPSDTSVGAPASGPGPAGPYTREAGTLAYYEICSLLSSGATQAWDEPQDVPYAYKGNEWVGYDNEKSFSIKVDWLKKNNFGGAMVWALDMDDFTGEFCKEGKYPLINTLKKGLGLQNGGEWIQERGGSFWEENSEPNGIYADPNNNKNFYNCVNGQTFMQSCEQGLVFDPVCSCCNWPQ
ncbi:acidic mammalian chitinase-like, partial [Malurus melanocephalus]|uniref:acidic mammalian chitinase-like n=1 Tax=Malurus melanocephalus TaxID=175006 RepID=UPI0025496838